MIFDRKTYYLPTGCPICIWTTLLGCLEVTGVGNIWVFSPLVLSKWEDLAFSVCIIFEKSVFIFQFLKGKMHNYVLFNTFVHFIIQKLKNKHTFLKTEKAKFARRENLVFSLCILFEESVFIFQFFNEKQLCLT